jgi:hypothetical protein
MSDVDACARPVRSAASRSSTIPAAFAASSRRIECWQSRSRTDRPATLAPAAVAAPGPGRRNGVRRDRGLVRGRARADRLARVLCARRRLHGGAVNTQTEALTIRGIAVGVPVRHILARELATGAIMGAGIAAVFLPFAWAVWGDGSIAFASPSPSSQAARSPPKSQWRFPICCTGWDGIRLSAPGRLPP